MYAYHDLARASQNFRTKNMGHDKQNETRSRTSRLFACLTIVASRRVHRGFRNASKRRQRQGSPEGDRKALAGITIPEYAPIIAYIFNECYC